MEIGQVRSLLSGYEHERGHVHGFYRRRDREDSHASPHAIAPNFPLQLEILRQRRDGYDGVSLKRFVMQVNRRVMK